ncbi:MAG: DUF484 family protein [Desulfobacterales bacterium]|jgi:diguanylate cyclase (GGDEF)-like protein|nr:DUF484 family protein [Desulfobacteraceae bacterium]MBT4365163.1 DUF484 family protein [Desulfobacteraceae bacterium]MBT7086378.1 DUF484 family protein [Desulfobacterales bacterium]MBT7696257.1 DUF484 family protein [Desulfobacterales bacterium]
METQLKKIEMDDIIERLKENENLSRKFHNVETKILSILDFQNFFKALLDEIKMQFQIPYAWISMINNCEVSNLIDALDSSIEIQRRINFIKEETFLNLIDKNKPLLVNENLETYSQLYPSGKNSVIESIALLPISFKGDIIGSLNLADLSKKRFSPGIDTFLLKQLALKVSLCLSNVTAHEKIKFFAYHDPLTNLLNRRVMETVLEREFKRSKRYTNQLSVVFLDLDYFKNVNDIFGHAVGDEVLIIVADILSAMCRVSDVVTRFGGDEFVIILPETKIDKAKSMMNRINNHIKASPLVVQGESVNVSLSFGIASTEDKTINDYSKLLDKADKALYQIKALRK